MARKPFGNRKTAVGKAANQKAAQKAQPKINSRAAEVQANTQAQRRAVAGTTGEGQRLSGGQTKAGGSIIKRAQFDPDTGEMLRNADGSPVTVSEAQRGFTFGDTEGADRAKANLEGIAGGQPINQATITDSNGTRVSAQDPQDIARSEEIAGGLGGLQAGAMGRPGATGFDGAQPRTASEAADAAIAEHKAKNNQVPGYLAPELLAVIRESAANEFLANTQAQSVQQDIAQREAQRTADNAAASAEATAQRDTQGQQASQVQESQDNALFSQLSALVQDDPVAQQVLAGLQGEAAAESQVLSFAGKLFDRQQELANNTFDTADAVLSKQEARAEDTFNKLDKRISDSYEKKNKLLATNQENQLQQLKFQEDKLVRDSRKAQRKQLDSMTVTMALMGRAGSVSANNELNNAEFEGEQAIIDLQKEFGFKRTDVSSFYTEKFLEAEDQMYNDWFTAKDKLDSELSRIETQGITNTSLRNTTISNALNQFADSYNTSKREGAKAITRANEFVYEAVAAERKAKLDGIIPTGDTLKFVDGLTKDINANKFIADARNVDTRFRSIESQMLRIAEAEASGDTAAKNFADQSLINLFNKITDPTSVVRESEFARSAAGLSLVQRVEAGFRRVREGGVLEPKARQELLDAAKTLNDQYKQQLQRDIQPYIARINMFNSQGSVQTPVKLSDVMPVNLIPQVPQATYDLWKSQIKGSQGSIGSGEPLPGFLSPENAPPEGYRTDRHNNPTAFTTGVAKQAGLVEGVDYEVGDAFPNNPNLKTARLLSDPIDTTVRVIDRIGFHTKGGQQRWKHTAMDKASWDSMTRNQKAQVVAQMYQREGGTGQLVGETQVANATEPILGVPTASAADFPQETTFAEQQSEFASQKREALNRPFSQRAGAATREFAGTFGQTTGESVRGFFTPLAGFGSEFMKGFNQQ